MAEDEDEDLQQAWTRRGWDRLLSVQRPVVLAHLRSIRKHLPDGSPDDVIRVLERRYVRAVTAGGAATGAVAVVPGVGTVAALGISGAETVGFLEASALFAQSVAEVYGTATEDPERASTMVMALMLGPSGAKLVEQFAGEVHGGKRRSEYWGDIVGSRLPSKLLKPLSDRVRQAFVRRFVVRQGGSVLLRVVPFGIGAVVGGIGNRMAARQVVKGTRQAFGPAPTAFPNELVSAVQAEERALDGGHVD